MGPLTLVFGVSLVLLPSILLPTDAKELKHKGGNLLVRLILDTKAFHFMAKVSFGSYLVHAMYMEWYLASIKSDFYYTFSAVYAMSTSLTVLCILSGVVVVYLVETPFSKIQRRMMTKIMFYKK